MSLSADPSKREQLEDLLRTALASATACGRGEVPREEAPDPVQLTDSVLALLETSETLPTAAPADPRTSGIAA